MRQGSPDVRGRSRRPRPEPAAIEPSADGSRRREAGVAILGVALLAATLVALHGPVLRFPFISDDYVFLVDIWSSRWSNLFGAFNTVQNYFRPLGRELYFYSLSLIAGNHPLAYRTVNLAMLIGIVALVMRLTGRFAGPRAALLAAAVYTLLYPHRVEMAWVSCSQDLIATLLALVGTLAYLDGRRVRAGFAFFLALFAKESVAPLPVILTVWEAWRASPRPPIGALARRMVGRTAPLWLGAAAWAAVVLGVRVWRRAWAPGSTVPVADVTLRLDRFWEGIRSAVLTYGYADQPWRYLREGFRHMEIPWIAMALVVGVALLASAVPAGRRGATAGHEPGEGLRLGILWSTIGVLPIGLVGHHFSAYYVCFSAVGFALLTGMALARLPVAATASVLALSAVLNVAANSTETFLILSDEEDPGVSYVPISRLAQEARFLDSLQVAMRRDPPPRGALVYLSHAPHRASFATAGERAPQVWFRDTTLTLTYIGQYRPGATDRPTRFLRFDDRTRGFVSLPESLVSAIVEGEDRMAAGDWAGARAALLRALDRTRPGLHDLERIELGNSLGVASNRAGDSAAARAAWRGVLALDPTHRGALLNLAGLDASAGHYREARAQVERLLERHPDDALGLLYLARLERALGDAAAVDRAWSRLVATDRRFADSVLAVSGMP